ncbi:MAG: putative methyltransferase [Myxococcales bacterium]|nr:putative methyltransferase [Myxococcales bacterium]
MERASTPACVVIGPNSGNFDQYLADRKEMREIAGGYRDAQVNSLLIDGKRISYLDWFNQLRREVDPGAQSFGAFDPPSLAELHLVSRLARDGQSAVTIGEFQQGRTRLEALLRDEPPVVAITTTFCFEPKPVREIVDFVRARSPRTKLVVGGPYIWNLAQSPSRRGQDLLFTEMAADVFVVDSQGESTLARVVTEIAGGRAGELANTPNLALPVDGKWVRTARSVEDNPLDTNRVDWSLFDAESLRPFAMTRTAISCPFACSFCTYPVRAGEHRLASMETMEAELRALDALGVRYVDFIDDTFNVPLPRFKQLCRMLIRNRFNFRWISYLRCGNMDEEAVHLAAESGCVGALLGIESGSKPVLEIMNKFANPEKYRTAIRWLEDAGIMCWALLFVGFPGETAETMRETIQLIADARPTFFGSQIWFYDPKTPIGARANEFAIKGSGYGWKHNTMDWRIAADGAEELIRSPNNSIYLPQTAFTLETFMYLMGKGFAKSTLQDFLRTARAIVVDGFGDRPVDLGKYGDAIGGIKRGLAAAS